MYSLFRVAVLAVRLRIKEEFEARKRETTTRR